jgi:hypothetical protein
MYVINQAQLPFVGMSYEFVGMEQQASPYFLCGRRRTWAKEPDCTSTITTRSCT